MVRHANPLLQNVVGLGSFYLTEKRIIIFVGHIDAKPCLHRKLHYAIIGFFKILLYISFNLVLVLLGKVVKVTTGEIYTGKVVEVGLYIPEEVNLLKRSTKRLRRLFQLLVQRLISVAKNIKTHQAYNFGGNAIKAPTGL